MKGAGVFRPALFMPDFFTDLVEQAENLVLPEAQFPRRPITGSRVFVTTFLLDRIAPVG